MRKDKEFERILIKYKLKGVQGGSFREGFKSGVRIVENYYKYWMNSKKEIIEELKLSLKGGKK